MDEGRIATALSGLLGDDLSRKLAAEFLKIRRDYATRTLERAAPGKFVEVLVQCFQFMGTGTYDLKPDVEDYLAKRIENSSLPPDLRTCAARIARSIYTLRNKRNIAHVGQVDPNSIDLAFIHSAASWIMSELLRSATGLTMQQAGEVIELIQAPVGTLVEEIDGVRLVHADTSIRAELLVLLHSHYPLVVPVKDVVASLSRRNPRTVRDRLRGLHADKLAHGSASTGYRLTQAGYSAAVAEIQKLQP